MYRFVAAFLASFAWLLPEPAHSTFFLQDIGNPGIPARKYDGPDFPPESEVEVADPKLEAICVSDDDFEKSDNLNNAIDKAKRLVIGERRASFQGPGMLTFEIKFRHLDTIVMEVNELLGRPGDGGSDFWGRAEPGMVDDADLLTLQRGYLDLNHGDFWVTKFQAEHSTDARGPKRGLIVTHYSCVFSHIGAGE